jgi:amino acid adenylation domain-containing protein/non-ribosomal peptide synthase protein (TIGR01720 family)
VLPLKTDSFQRWALLQKDYAAGSKLQKERSYWEAQCHQVIEKLPQDKLILSDETVLINSNHSFNLDKKTTELLQTHVHGVYKTEINDVLLAGLALAIKEVLSKEKSVLKLEGHGREEIIEEVDISRTVGWFSTIYPFVLDISDSTIAREALVKIKESLRKVPNKGIGYGILRYLSEEGLDTTITPEIIFNYLGDFGSNAGGGKDESIFEYVSEGLGSSMSKDNGDDAILNVSGIMIMGELHMSIGYSQLNYHSQTIEKLIRAYEKNLTRLIKELSTETETYLTPADLTFKGLSIEELALINADGNVEDVYELSPLQEGMFYHWLSDEFGSLYFGQVSYRVKSNGLDIKKIRRAYDSLIARHGMLRTSFSSDYAGRFLQIVRKKVTSNFTYEHIENYEDKQAYVNYVKQKDTDKGFDLRGPSQMRMHIINLNDGEYEFIWSHHHILMDGWCMSILVNDFNEFLSAETLEKPSNLSSVVPYSNYIGWLNKINRENSLNYWKGYLADYTQVAELPFKKKTEEKTNITSAEVLQIDGDWFKKIDALCNRLEITLNSFMQGVWGYLLSRYNNTTDVVFGVVVSGRPAELEGVENMIGLFINTIPVRVQYKSEQSPIELLKSLQERSIEATFHHYMNLSDVQSLSEPGVNLINHIMIFQNFAVKELTDDGMINTEREEGISIQSMDVFEQTNYDFNIKISPLTTSLNINIAYDSIYYDAESIRRLIKHFDNLIKAFVLHAEKPLQTLKYLSPEEQNELSITFNDTIASYPKDKTIVDFFEGQSLKTPDNIAVSFKDQELTYHDLNEQSNQLAHYLQKNYEIQANDLIGIRLERSEWVIIAILAVLKSGGAYVPIDPDYPEERINYIEKDAKCKVCIDEKELNKFRRNLKKYSKAKINSSIKRDDLAYVIYTSGSTGNPKGVLIPHKNLSNFFHNGINTHDSKSTIVQPFIASYAFDISIFQLFTPLLSGGKSIVVSKEDLLDTTNFLEILSSVTVIDTVPAVYETLLNAIRERGMSDNFLHMERVFIGGDTIPDQLLLKLSQIFRSAEIIVTYGPTEGTIFCTQCSYSNSDITNKISGSFIGSPKNNVQIYILDNGLNLTPINVTGEIYIGGDGLALGYLNQPSLTLERFIHHPFKKGEKLYKTGDLGRRTSDGGIEFVGRNDDQVKIRGYRIELGEVSNQLRKLPGISDAVVMATQNEGQEKALTAYFVKQKNIQVWPSISEYLGYNDLAYFAMNADELRAGSYKQAIGKLVKDKVVVDVGTGPDAILAQHCINAGAKKVYAIEILEEVYEKAKKTITSLGLEEKIILIHGDVLDIELPEKVDYCVCALVGNMGSSDGCIPVMNTAKRFMKDHSCMIPYRSLTKISAIHLPEDQTNFSFTESGAHYLNAIFENTGRKFDIRIGLQNVTRDQLISTTDVFEDLDLRKVLPLNNKRSITLKITTTSKISGFLVWLNLYTTPDIVNDIFESQKSFLPIYFPVFEVAEPVEPGDKIEGEVHVITSDDSIYPDYFISGKLIRCQGEELSFSYLSSRLTKEYGNSSFYKQIFPNGEFGIKASLSTENLRNSLQQKLPDYMLPSFYVELDKIPLTPNGKIDKQNLQKLGIQGLYSQLTYVAPRNETEEKLVKIWQELLQRETISVKDDFFALGGHSLKAVRLSNEYQKMLGVKISLKDLFTYSNIAAQADLINSLNKVEFKQIQKIDQQDYYPISDAQRRLWVLSQFENSSVTYNLPGSHHLDQSINIENFKKAIIAVLDRHEILRTVFKEDKNGEVKQWVLRTEDLDFKIDYKDFRKIKNKEEKIASYMSKDAQKIFDLEKGPLLRAALLQIAETNYIFYFNMHHIISDAWSMEVLSNDVLSYYDAYQANKEPFLTELRIQYKDYSAWQLAQLSEESYKKHKLYWLNNLQGKLPLLDLPSSRQRPRLKTYKGYMLGTYIEKKTSKKLKEYIQRNGGTLFMGLLSSVKVLLYRYTSQSDIIIGTPIAAREHSDLESQIGFYVNTLVLRNEIKPSESFDELFSKVKENTLQAYNHQMYPFDRLVEELGLIKDTSRSAVFDLMMSLQDSDAKFEDFELKGNLEQIKDLGTQTSKFDIEISFKETGDYISLFVIYNVDIYDRDMVEGFLRHYKQLLAVILESPEESLSQLDYQSTEEKDKLLRVFNDTSVDYPKDKTIINLFEEQVGKTPHNTAIVFREKELTYKELDEASNRLARYLKKEYEIDGDDLIGIKQEKSDWLIISILAVLKSGAGYVPIDSETPQDRIDYIEKDSKCKICIDETELNNFRKSEKRYSKEKIASFVNSGNLAYVIYTSGSTGKPKGVMIEHGNLTQFLSNALVNYQSDSPIILPFVASAAFDISLFQLFVPLITGGCSILVTKEDFQSLGKFSEILKSSTVMDTVPAMYEPLINYIRSEGLSGSYSNIKKVFVGGDRVSDQLLRNLSEIFSSASINVLYGPTEGTIFCTNNVYESQRANQQLNGSIIGSPNNNVSIYIVNESIQLQPIGVMGEICISGGGLARGYLNQEELTKERFIENPFKSGERLYKTGDLGRWLMDGKIEFMGRKDNQVKIRGYRIELGEIEHCLLNHPSIEEAVVIARENENQEKELVAYITAKTEQNISELRLYLRDILPEYMLPSHYIQLESMPLTSNGKIDKKSLPDPEGIALSTGASYVAPKSMEEKILSDVWSDVLRREEISIKESFYNLGGDSIKSIQVVSRLKQKGYTLKVEHLLRTPILEELALLMEKGTGVINQSEVKGIVELTPIQKWFFEEPLIKVPSHYNQSVLLRSNEELNKEIIEKSISDLTKHHDALRMIYKKSASGWVQLSQDANSNYYAIDFYDLRSSLKPQEELSKISEGLQSSINLELGVFKVVHFRMQDGDRLGLIVHHLVVDGVSWRILLEDLSLLYLGYKANKNPDLPLKTDSFQRWALLQKEYAESNKIKNERAYWVDICEHKIDSLPQDHLVNSSYTIIDSSSFFRLDNTTTQLLQTRVHGVYKTEINDVLLTGLSLALKEVFSKDKSVLKMEGHGREDVIEGVDISRTVGWFTTMFPFVLDISGLSNEIEALVAVKESLRKVPNKGIGYGIVKYLSKEGLEDKLVPEIVFNYLGDFGNNVTGTSQNSMFGYASEHFGSNASTENGNDAILDVFGMLVDGELNMSIRFCRDRYSSITIEKLIRSYEKNLIFLIKELSKQTDTYLTPSDLSFKGLNFKDLLNINSDNTIEDVYELSPLQGAMYYQYLSGNSNTLYSDQTSYRIRTKELDLLNLKRAYDGLIARHGILRTSFTNDYGRFLQIVHRTVASNFSFENIENQPDKEKYVLDVKKKDREKGFDLKTPSQMRLHIIDLLDGTYEFIWSHHHILMDGWCMSVLINDFNELLGGNTAGLSPVKPYSNYVNWLNKQDKEGSLSYWKTYLSDYTEVTPIPFKIKTTQEKYIESREQLQIKGELFNKINALCNKLNITQNVFIQGAWGYLLSKYNNTRDVVFGTVVSGRPGELQGVEDMIGLFINTIPVRIKYELDDTFIDLLKTIQEKSIESTSHHYVNFLEVQSQSEPGIHLMDHTLVFENFAVTELTNEGILNARGEAGLSIESREIFEETTYDFNVLVGPSSTALNIDIRYNTNKYENLSVKRLINHFNNIINALVEHTDQPLHALNYLSEEENHELVVTFNDTAVTYQKDKTIVNLFDEQVQNVPNNIAIVFEGKELTYQELNEHSNRLAHYLQKSYQIKPDELIGIKLERSEWIIISILAILKAGAAYVPIDPAYPKERIDYIEKDSNCKICIDKNELFKFKENEEIYSKDSPISQATAHHLAYVIYTSGSTGTPKGVMVEHHAILNTLLSQINLFEVSNKDKGLQFASFSFDASISETFIILISGASLFIISEDERNDPELLTRFINTHAINIATLPPSYLNKLNLKLLKRVNKLITAGESAVYEKAISHLESGIYYNAYGPSEAGICSTIFKVVNEYSLSVDIVPIGKPIHNTQLYLLNEEQKLVPKGIVGEIYISGSGLARGYLNQEKLTNQMFTINPFKVGERLYKTGDLGRWLSDGNLEFLGRKDDQVKIRGYRVEPGEIEYALLKHIDVKEAVVMAKENKNNERELVAYIISKTPQNANVLRTFLKDLLPEYMIPGYYVQVDMFPLTSNGKINKKVLLNLEGRKLGSETTYLAPANETEEKLIEIWEEQLVQKNIGVGDDFFDFGGNSLKVIRLSNQYKKLFNKKMPLSFFISNPTIREHAAYIDSDIT